MNNIEFSSYEEIINLQTFLLRQTLKYVYENSKYYRKIYEAVNMDFDTFTIDTLKELPVITKEDLLKNNAEFFCCDESQWLDIVTTSGSTGVKPILHPLTYNDLMRLTYNEEVSFLAPPLTSNDFVMLATALDGSFVAGLAYYLGLKGLGINVVRAGSKNLSGQLSILRDLPVNTIIGVPSNLIKLYNLAGKYGLSKEILQINKIVLIGESIREKDLTLNQLGKRVAKCFKNASLYSTYANTETCVSFCECEKGQGGHLHPDLAYVEILNAENKRVKSGEVGRLVITTFGCQSMPLIRYDTGDLTYIIEEKCECGRNSLRIGPILGRQNNILKVGGVTFSKRQLEDIVLSDERIIDYCVKVERDKNGVTFVNLYIACVENDAPIKEEMIRKIWENVRASVNVHYSDLNDLLAMQKSMNSRKPIRFINMTNEVEGFE